MTGGKLLQHTRTTTNIRCSRDRQRRAYKSCPVSRLSILLAHSPGPCTCVLLQLPQGAVALDGAVGTISKDTKLLPYTSMSLQQTLYFPQPGVYLQAPVSVVSVTGRCGEPLPLGCCAGAFAGWSASQIDLNCA